MKIKINIGGGENRKINGWINIDVGLQNEDKYNNYNYYDLNSKLLKDVKSNFADYIISNNVFEHLTFDTGYILIGECYRILKPGGKLKIIVPDLDKAIYSYEKTNPKYCLLLKKNDRFKKYGWRNSLLNSFLVNYSLNYHHLLYKECFSFYFLLMHQCLLVAPNP